MPLTVTSNVQRNVVVLPLVPLVIPAGQAVEVFQDVTKQSVDFQARYAQTSPSLPP